MNHDFTHCAEYSNACPKTCFRAQAFKAAEEINLLECAGKATVEMCQ